MTPMFRRAPKYTVTTAALVFIAVAAFGLRYASRFLPERMPNRLQLEHGEYVKRSIRETVDWYPLGQEAFDIARRRGKILFFDIGTVASLSAKRFSEDYATDGEYRQLLHDHFEAVKIDALEMPWVVDALAPETHAFLGTERFLAVAIDHTGGVIDWSPIRPKEGEGSMASWLEGLARLRYSDTDEVRHKAAKSLERRKSVARAALSPGVCDPDSVEAWLNVWVGAAKSNTFAKERWPVSTLPMQVMLEQGNTDGVQLAVSLMTDLSESPCYDAVDGGFFIFGQEMLWRRPVAAKLTGHSLQVAAAYAEAAARHRLPLFAAIAKSTADWSATREIGGVFDAGLGTDQIDNGSSPYYSFSQAEVEPYRFSVGPFGLPRIPRPYGTVSRTDELRTQQVFSAVPELRKVRIARTAPRADSGRYANQNGQAVSGLFRIGAALEDQAIIDSAKLSYSAIRSSFVLALGDVHHATRGTGRTTGYVDDYVWVARAALDGYLATGDHVLLEDATRITGRMLELFRGPEGALASFFPSLLEFAGFSQPIYRIEDTELPSSNAVAVMNLADLASLTGQAGYRDSALGIVRAFSGKFVGAPAPPGMALAARRIFNPVSRPSKS